MLYLLLIFNLFLTTIAVVFLLVNYAKYKDLLEILEILKGGEHVAKLFATLVIAGRITFKEVPDLLKERTKQVLIDVDCEFLVTEEVDAV